MRVVVSPSDREAAELAADTIASLLAEAIAVRGTASLALSGGQTAVDLVRQLVTHDIAWPAVHVFQVDERAVPLHDPARNWLIVEPLAELVPESNRHPMPVEANDADLRYSELLRIVVGSPLRLDVVHLGLGTDGHTASLVPGDAALDVADRDVSWVERYQGHRRLTLTIPPLVNARHQAWFVRGSAKADALRDLTTGDSVAPSALVLNRATATLFLDADAAALIGS